MLWAILIAAAVIAAMVLAHRIAFARLEKRVMRGIHESAERFRATGELPPAPRPPSSRVTVSDDAVEVKARGQRRQRIEWAHLSEVAVRTTPGGPWREDVFFLLSDDRGGGVVVPQTESSELLERLQRLPGFDNRELVRAMGSTEDELFVCWRRA